MSVTPVRHQIKAETPAAKLRRCLDEAREYLRQIESSGAADTAETASAAIWDAILDAQLRPEPNLARVPRDSGLISRDWSMRLASGVWRMEP